MGLLYRPDKRIDYSNKKLESVDGINFVCRLGAWCIDTIIILSLYLLFILFFFYYQSPYLGSTYSMIIGFRPDEYKYVEHEPYFFFYFFVILFYFFDVLYYFINEAIGDGATIGLKIVCRHKIKMICVGSGRKVPMKLLVMRQLYFVFIVIFTWLLSYYFNCCYLVAIILNVLIIYTSILGGEKQTLLGYLTSTYYAIEKQKNQVTPEKGIEEKSSNSCVIVESGGYKELEEAEVLQNDKKQIDDKMQQNDVNTSILKKLFPFNEGFKRLLIVLWLLISLYVEVINWKIRGYGIENYAVGLIPLFSLPILYLMFLWIYYGFKK